MNPVGHTPFDELGKSEREKLETWTARLKKVLQAHHVVNRKTEDLSPEKGINCNKLAR